MLDISAMGMLCMFALGVVVTLIVGQEKSSQLFSHDVFNNQLTAPLITLPILIIPLAWVTSLSGATLGKYVFGIRVMTPNGRPLSFRAALRREANVWLEGMWLGIPILWLVAMAIAHSQLKKLGRNSWDPPATSVVEYRAMGVGTVVRIIVGVLLLVCAWLAATISYIVLKQQS